MANKTTTAPRKSDAVSPRPAASASSKKRPTQEEIAKKAYEIYLRRGGTPGNETEDWLQAERELMEGKK
jgi:hypothetical protein